MAELTRLTALSKTELFLTGFMSDAKKVALAPPSLPELPPGRLLVQKAAFLYDPLL